MRLTGAGVYTSSVPKLPQGLVEYIEGLTRDVLKNNPENVYEFCAEHTRKLLEIRDGPRVTKPMALERKIAKALDKLKERAESRRSEFPLQSTQSKDLSEVDEPLHEKVNIEPLMGDILKAPVHHEKELSEDLEVEIFHESIKVGPTIVEELEDDENILLTSNVEESEDQNIISRKTNELTVITPIDFHNKVSPDEVNKKDEVLEISVTNSTYENSDYESLEKKHVSQEFAESKDRPISNEVETLKSLPLLNCEDTEIVYDENIEKITTIIKESSDEVVETESGSLTQGSENKAQEITVNETNMLKENVTIDISDTPIEIINKNECGVKIDESAEMTSENDQNNKIKKSTGQSIKDHTSPLPETNLILLSSLTAEPQSFEDVHENAINYVDILSDGIPDLEAIIESEDTNLKALPSQNNFKNSNTTSNDSSRDVDPTNETFSTEKCTPEEVTSEDSYLELSTGIHTRDSSPTNVSTAMDLETAAITIQKVFRNFMFKSRNSTDDAVHDEAISFDESDTKTVETEFQSTSPSLNKDRRPLGLTRMDTVLQTVNEEKSLSLSTDDSSLSSAATVIQAHVRGFLVRNQLNINKTLSSSSLVNSDRSTTSLEAETDPQKKTVLNIHIVPDGEHFISRDESLLTSMDLSLDSSPPTSKNLHPMMSYDTCERRKQLKREDAIQSVSPPSNNSGKLSEDVDSVKDLSISDNEGKNHSEEINDGKENITLVEVELASNSTSPSKSATIETVVEVSNPIIELLPDTQCNNENTIGKVTSDELDVVTPNDDKQSSANLDVKSQLLHSGEFHDIVLPTKVSRSDTVVREFKNVLAYLLIWNNS